MTVTVFKADYTNKGHADAIRDLFRAYMRDPMGGGIEAPEDICEKLIPALLALPNAFSVLAMVGDVPAGLANCFEGFSTFAARPLINIHDLVVDEAFRGQGIATRLLAKVEAIARDRDCCKLTLEVLGGNAPAMALYRSQGFGDYVLNPAHGAAQFWQKRL